MNFRTDLAIERREVSPHTDDGLKVDEFTVVDANTLVNDIAENEIEYRGASAMIVTPKEIDLLIERSARLISHSINCALQPDIDEDSLLMLTD